MDLAFLRLAKVPEGAKALGLAGDKLPERGAKVLALGHPQGFQFVSTDGIVSATHRTEQLPPRFLQSGFIHSAADVVWVQTTAAVGPGNSGGPLLDGMGKVIGVIQWMAGGQGMNFALHVASVRKLLAKPEKLVSLVDFTQPNSELQALMRDLQMDLMKPFPADEKNPLADKADHDDLVLWLACKEARETLGITAKPGK